MARTTVMPETTGETLGGATILPGVPLPVWGRPAEPVVPEAPPVERMAPPAPAAISVPPAVEPLPSQPPAPLELDAVPTLAPAGPVAARHAAYAAAGAAPATFPEGSAALDLSSLVPPTEAPELTEPPAATAPVAALPDAPPPVGLVPVDLAPPVEEPLDASEVDQDAGDRHRHADGSSAEPAGSRRLLVLVGSVGGALALGALAAFVWPGFLVSSDESTAPLPRAAAPAARAVTLQAPATAAGLTRLDGAPAAALAKTAAATTLPGYAAPVTAVYGTGSAPGATVVAWNAAQRGRAVDPTTAFVGYQSASGSTVTGIAPVPAGALGGSMSCGSATVGTTPASVCFWSDDATLGAVTVLRPASPAAGAATAMQLRAAVETRS